MQQNKVARLFSRCSPTTRIIALTIVTASVGGFVVGWFALSPSSQSSSSLPKERSNSLPELVQVTHKFPLLPADIRCDHETPSVADAQGRILVAWATQTGDSERTITLARSSDGGTTFETPVPFRKVPITRFTTKGQGGKGWTFSTNVAPRLAANQASVFLAWVEAMNGGPQVKFLVARSNDGGQTFSDPVCVNGIEAVRPGFTTLSTGPDGSVSCAWLDGRHQAQQPFVSISDRAGAEFRVEKMVYAGPEGKGVCPCCDLATVRAGDGTVFIAFRNAEAGNRDVCVTRARADGGFEPPVAVTAAHWPFNGCPHDGPSLALCGERLHVLWMDAHSGKRRVYHAHTGLADLRFSPLEVDASAVGEQGHPYLATDSDGTLHAAWDESLSDEPGTSAKEDAGSQHNHSGHYQHGTPMVGRGRAIRYVRLSQAGKVFDAANAVAPRPGTFQMQPRLTIGPSGRVYIVWNELTADSKSVVFARLAR